MPTAAVARATWQLVMRNAEAGNATAWGRGACPLQAVRQGTVGHSCEVHGMGEPLERLSVVVQRETAS